MFLNALAVPADPEHGVVGLAEADVYRLSPCVGAGLRSLIQFGRCGQVAERRYAPLLALVTLTGLSSLPYTSP